MPGKRLEQGKDRTWGDEGHNSAPFLSQLIDYDPLRILKAFP